MSRHTLRTGTGLIALLAACATPALADSLTVSNWDGYMAADAIDTFNSETGHSVDIALRMLANHLRVESGIIDEEKASHIIISFDLKGLELESQD